MLNSLNEPTRCRNHSRATKIGARTWKRNELCSKGVPCLSRIRKRIRPSSDSSISSFRRANETRAPLTTERSSAIASSSRTNPWSSTPIAPSGNTRGVTAIAPSVPGLYVGTSGWSYLSWRPGFYPAGLKPGEFLAHYATRFSAVELNTTGYRIPAEDQFRRWAGRVPSGFRFAPKLNAYRSTDVSTFEDRVRLLGDRLGPIRVLVGYARDEGQLALMLGSLAPELQLAFDFRHGSWEGVEAGLPPNATTINDLDSGAAFRYLRLREPPY